MSGYLPLCAFRQGLLPPACNACAWWQTTGSGTHSPAGAADIRRRWLASLEDSWGAPGLLLEVTPHTAGGASTGGSPADGRLADAGLAGSTSPGGGPVPVVAASVTFAPTDMVPRLRDLSFGMFGTISDGSALVFCLGCRQGQPRYQAKRVLHKALRQLQTRGITEVYAIGVPPDALDSGGALHGVFDGDRCRFLPLDFLSTNGFQAVAERDGLTLTRLDLRGLLSLVGRVQSAVKRALGNEPAPSPAAWTRG